MHPTADTLALVRTRRAELKYVSLATVSPDLPNVQFVKLVLDQALETVLQHAHLVVKRDVISIKLILMGV